MTADALAQEGSWSLPTRDRRASGRTDAGDPGRVAANARLALVADLASKGSIFVVLAIVAHVLSTGEFALLGVSLAVVTVLTTVLDAGTSVVLVRDGRGTPGPALSMLRASAIVRIPLALVVVCGGLAVGSYLGHPLEGTLVVASAVVAAASLNLVALFRVAEMFAVEVAQKLWAAAFAVLGVIVLVAGSPTAAAALAGLCLGTAATLPALVRRARALAGDAPPFAGPSPLRTSAPFGLIAVATILYYRVPTLVLGAAGSSTDTATYALASTIALGLLAFPNAITSALLPRLADLSDGSRRVAVARRSLIWSVQLWALLAIGVATVARPLLALSFGARYADAAAPLEILLVAGLLISASGAFGTTLAAARHTGILVAQVIVSLAVNLVLATALIPRWGASGAATATLATEAASLALIAAAAWGRIDGLLRRPSFRALACAFAAALLAAAGSIAGGVLGVACGAAAAVFVIAADPGLASRLRPYRVSTLRQPAAVPSGVFGVLAGTAILAAWAAATNYGMRVISDTPTYLALVPRLAARPFEPLSPFLDTPGVADSHASPYLQLLAWIWSSVGARHDAAGRPVLDPTELGRFLGLVGIVVMLIVLHSVFVFARRETGARAAWVTLPVLLLLFGPAHVIWAGDLTFHGFMYGAYFPQTLAVALLLATVLVTEYEPSAPRYVVGTACAAATLLVHPLTGLLLAVLIAIRGSTLAHRRDPAWRVGPICVAAGCGIGLAWPGYSLAQALGEAGANGPLLIAMCAAVPAVFRALPRVGESLGARARTALAAWDRHTTRVRLAVIGTALTLVLAAWEAWLFTRPNSDPLIHSNHLSLYWVEDRWRWPLMFAAGAVGLSGLVRLALRGRTLPLLWFAGCFTVGVAGVLGLPLPIWWRLLLFCQIPLALGVAVVVVETASGSLRRIVVSTFAFVAVFKVATLFALSPKITYFDTPVQNVYELSQMVPARPGLVASDPFSSYFIPAVTDHRVLVVTKAHVDSQAELAESAAGYRLLHEFFMGAGWWKAAQTMYRRGVRYVLIDKQTSLRPPTLAAFSTGPTPLVRTRADERLLGTYFYRNNRVGRLLVDGYPYVLYALDRKKLFR